jgi:hypothetical protein
MFFKLLHGTHYEDEKRYVASDPNCNVVESNKPLDKAFKGKFEKLTCPPPAGTGVGSGLGTEPSPTTGPVKDFGIDVTDTFLAVLGLRVFRHGRVFNILDESTGEKLNEKPLSRAEADGFVSDFANEVESSDAALDT